MKNIIQGCNAFSIMGDLSSIRTLRRLAAYFGGEMEEQINAVIQESCRFYDVNAAHDGCEFACPDFSAWLIIPTPLYPELPFTSFSDQDRYLKRHHGCYPQHFSPMRFDSRGGKFQQYVVPEKI